MFRGVEEDFVVRFRGYCVCGHGLVVDRNGPGVGRDCFI